MGLFTSSLFRFGSLLADTKLQILRDPGISGLNSHPDLGICENRIPLFFGIYYINQSNEFKAKNVKLLILSRKLTHFLKYMFFLENFSFCS